MMIPKENNTSASSLPVRETKKVHNDILANHSSRHISHKVVVTYVHPSPFSCNSGEQTMLCH